MKINIIYEYEEDKNIPINMAAAIIKFYKPSTYDINEPQDRIDDLDELIEHLQAFTHRGIHAWEPFDKP